MWLLGDAVRLAMNRRGILSGAGTCLDGLAAAGTSGVHLARGLGVGADVLEGGSVAVVGVDANNFASVAGGSALDVDVALALTAALIWRDSSQHN